MSGAFSLVSLALMGSALAAPAAVQTRQTVDTTATTNLTLIPVVVNPDNTTTVSTEVTLPYGLDDAVAPLVNVSLTTNVPAVLLESIVGITTVDCSSDSVNLIFNDAATLDSAFNEWTAADTVLLITNHVGDCDTDNERGFFLAGDFVADTTAMTLFATAERKNLTDVAITTEMSFSNIPAVSVAAAKSKRAISYDDGALSIASEWDLPSTVLYEYDPYVVATAERGLLSTNVTLAGYLKFSILTLSLDALYVDLNTTIAADLVLDLDVKAAYANTFAYNAPELQYLVVDVPGIITFGPELIFGIGAAVSAGGAVDVNLDLGADITNGNFHIDFVDFNATSASGWTPEYHANLTLSEEAVVAVDPYVSLTVGLEFKVLGGILDLSGGLTAKPSFPTNVTLASTQEAGTAGTNASAELPANDPTTCSQGARVQSSFEFELDAYVTQFYNVTLVDTSVAITDACYAFT